MIVINELELKLKLNEIEIEQKKRNFQLTGTGEILTRFTIIQTHSSISSLTWKSLVQKTLNKKPGRNEFVEEDKSTAAKKFRGRQNTVTEFLRHSQ
jgi:hypothetical protein